MVQNINILFVEPYKSSFIQNDLELLKKNFHVKEISFIMDPRRPIDTMRCLLGMALEVARADVTFSWFADLHALWAVRFSKIFGKKSIVVVGGYEVVNEPSIGYGGMTRPESASIVKYVLDNADRIIAVSETNMGEILNYIDPDRVDLIYNGIDCGNFKPKGEKETLVITVGYVSDINIKRKGLKTFVEAAKRLPGVNFAVIGPWRDSSVEGLISESQDNIKFTGYISNEELLGWYQRAKVYCQLSIHEAFGVALAESMCCQCVPVVTKNGALPEVVGDTGYYVPFGDVDKTVEAIEEALKSQKGREAETRIRHLYDIKLRERKLIESIESLLDQ